MRIILCLLFLASLRAQDLKPVPTKLAPEVTGALEFHPDLIYATYGDREVKLDLWRPKTRSEPLPAIVCIHGGGWFKGDRGGMANLAQALAARGFVAVTISYRLSGEAKFPAAIQDAKAAVRWLRANAATYGIRAERIGATGLSAGGHLAALLATSGGVASLEGAGGNADQSSAIQACVPMGAQSDLETDRIRELSAKVDDPFYRTFLGGSLQEIPQVYAQASPRHHLNKGDPPMHFLTGQLDDVSTRAAEMRVDLTRLQIPGHLMEIHGAPHSFLGQQSFFDVALNECDDFFTRHLKERLP